MKKKKSEKNVSTKLRQFAVMFVKFLLIKKLLNSIFNKRTVFKKQSYPSEKLTSINRTLFEEAVYSENS